jgi:hypothetical protein
MVPPLKAQALQLRHFPDTPYKILRMMPGRKLWLFLSPSIYYGRSITTAAGGSLSVLDSAGDLWITDK